VESGNLWSSWRIIAKGQARQGKAERDNAILTGKSLKGASFNAVEDLKTHIDVFIRDYNETARPFVWTKSKVYQKRLKPCFANQ
jgi:hypothetical protein